MAEENKEYEHRLEEVVRDFINDRGICEILKVNYNNPSKQDIERIRDYVKRFYAPWDGTRW